MSDFPGNGTAEDMEMVRFVTNRNVLIRPNPADVIRAELDPEGFWVAS